MIGQAIGRGAPRERREPVAGVSVFWREASAPTPAARQGGGTEATVLYLHGAPTSSDDFAPLLERTGGVALDLPGFGRSDKPAAFDYSVAGYGHFLDAFVELIAPARLSLVVHDWGAVGLALSRATLERLERLVVIDAVPFSGEQPTHRLARLWRTPVVGELTMGLATRWGLRRVLRPAFPSQAGAPADFVDRLWERFDHGTQRATLKLHRSAPPAQLAREGDRLAAVRCPALVVWGEEDPYLPASGADAYRGQLGGAVELEIVPGAGHWPWLERPELVGRIAAHLAKG